MGQSVVLAILALAMAVPAAAGETSISIAARRSTNNPLITTSTKGAGSNVCGPSVIRVPSWVKDPLGKYYMYFARHMSSSREGAYIRLAYANAPEGPWTAYAPGTLRRTDLKDKDSGSWRRKKQHIASPDVHVDQEKQRVILYFHGSYFGHNTGVAASKDGLHFVDQNVNLGSPYLRVFRHGGCWFGLSQGGRIDGQPAAKLRRFEGPLSAEWEEGPSLLPRARHLAVLKQAGRLIVFYSRIGDKPERILGSVIDLRRDWREWTVSRPIEVLKPEHPCEGSELPLVPSRPGTGRNKHELRDPCIFIDEGRTYLYYTVKGETGVAVAELTISDAAPTVR